jgi:pimeloyl-ACP methyl ester carboxylesterase
MIVIGLCVVVALLAAPLVYRQGKRIAAGRRLRISSPGGIDESGYVRIGGIDQWLSVRGDDRANPVIVEVHGGPGASNLIFAARTRAWERHFTVVRWDMRGAGKTFSRTGPGELSLDLLERDAVEVVNHIRARLGVPKVVLVANSFGSIIGLRLARNHPELFAAYVGTDQNLNAGGRDHGAYDALLDRLAKAGREKLRAEVIAMNSAEAPWDHERWARFAKIAVVSDPLTYDTMKTVVVRSLWFSPLHSLRDLRAYVRGMTFSEQLGPESTTIDEWAEGTRFAIPFFVVQGAQDVLTPPALAGRYVADVTAPVKDFVLIEDASHFASFRRPDRFLEVLLTRVRPIVTGQLTN